MRLFSYHLKAFCSRGRVNFARLVPYLAGDMKTLCNQFLVLRTGISDNTSLSDILLPSKNVVKLFDIMRGCDR